MMDLQIIREVCVMNMRNDIKMSTPTTKQMVDYQMPGILEWRKLIQIGFFS